MVILSFFLFRNTHTNTYNSFVPCRIGTINTHTYPHTTVCNCTYMHTCNYALCYVFSAAFAFSSASKLGVKIIFSFTWPSTVIRLSPSSVRTDTTSWKKKNVMHACICNKKKTFIFACQCKRSMIFSMHLLSV